MNKEITEVEMGQEVASLPCQEAERCGEEGVYEFIYKIHVIWDPSKDSYDYNYTAIRPKHDKEESTKIAVAMARIEAALYWRGLGRLCEETQDTS